MSGAEGRRWAGRWSEGGRSALIYVTQSVRSNTLPNFPDWTPTAVYTHSVGFPNAL